MAGENKLVGIQLGCSGCGCTPPETCDCPGLCKGSLSIKVDFGSGVIFGGQALTDYPGLAGLFVGEVTFTRSSKSSCTFTFTSPHLSNPAGHSDMVVSAGVSFSIPFIGNSPPCSGSATLSIVGQRADDAMDVAGIFVNGAGYHGGLATLPNCNDPPVTMTLLGPSGDFSFPVDPDNPGRLRYHHFPDDTTDAIYEDITWPSPITVKCVCPDEVEMMSVQSLAVEPTPTKKICLPCGRGLTHEQHEALLKHNREQAQKKAKLMQSPEYREAQRKRDEALRQRMRDLYNGRPRGTGRRGPPKK